MKTPGERIKENEDQVLQKTDNMFKLKMHALLGIITPRKILRRAEELNCTDGEYADLCRAIARLNLESDAETKAKIASSIKSDHIIAAHKIALQDQQKSQSFDFNNKTAEEIEGQLKHIAYLAEAKKSPLSHITPALTRALKLVPTELSLIGGLTGASKTSLTCYHAAKLLAKDTKVIIYSNETMAPEYYRRISCLVLDFDYSKRDSFTTTENTLIDEKAIELHNNNLLKIIDTNDTQTTSILALERVLEICKKEQDTFVLFIDYLQKITKGRSSGDNKTVVLEQVMDLLDSSRHELNGAIIAFTQLWPTNKDRIEFTDRTKWSRSITDRVDFALELVRDSKNSCAKLTLWKERNSGLEIGSEFPLILSNGRYLDPTPENIKKFGYFMTTDKNNEIILIKNKNEEDENG
jgi:hypothetical protein